MKSSINFFNRLLKRDRVVPEHMLDDSIRDLDINSEPKNETEMSFQKIEERYIDLFKTCTSIDEIFKSYIENAKAEELLEPLRLRLLNKYLVTHGFISNRLDNEDLKTKIAYLSKTDKYKTQDTEEVSKSEQNQSTNCEDEIISQSNIDGLDDSCYDTDNMIPDNMGDAVVVEIEINESINNDKSVSEKFLEIKTQYFNLFHTCNSIGAILRAYVENTKPEDLYDKLRLRYINMYLFNRKFIDEKLEEIYIKTKISFLSKTVNYKPPNQIPQEFIELHEYYSKVFPPNISFNETIILYINSTDKKDIFDNTRLRYLCMCLYKKEITKNKWHLAELYHYINELMANDLQEVINEERQKQINEYKIKQQIIKKEKEEALIIRTKLKDEQLCNHIKEFIIEETKTNKYSMNNSEFIDNLLVSTFCIDINFYYRKRYLVLEAIYKIFKELDFFSDYSFEEFRDYIDENILFIKDIIYYEGYSKEKKNGDAFFLKNNICIKYRKDTLDINLQKGIIIEECMYYDDNGHFHTDILVIKIKDIHFALQENEKEKVRKYYEQVNEKSKNEITEIINHQIKSINNSISELIKNYFKMLPSSLLLNREEYIAFEVLAFADFYPQSLLDSESNEQNTILTELRNRLDLSTNTQIIIDINYNKFVKILSRQLDISSEYYSIVAWSLIRKFSIEYFAHEWEKEYGNLHGENYIAFVDAYCRSLDIPHENIETIGLFTYYLMNEDALPTNINSNFLKCNEVLKNDIVEKLEEVDLERFERKLTNPTNKLIVYTIDDIDLMNGYEFEDFVAKIFTKMGYKAEVTKSSGDQGIDVIAQKNGKKIGIQAKCYSNKVSNTAIQEVSAGIIHYGCDKGIVVTNHYFTNSAIELAKSNNIVLWNRDNLKLKIDEIFI